MELFNKDEMDMMNEHAILELAEETLKAHNMPTIFSYRHAFTLGLEKGAELAKVGGGLSGLMAWMATAKARKETKEIKEKLDRILRFIDHNQWIGDDEKLIVMQIADSKKGTQ